MNEILWADRSGFAPAFVGNMGQPVALVIGYLSCWHCRVGVDSDITELVNSTNSLVTSLNNMSQVWELAQSHFLAWAHLVKLRNKLLEESLPSIPFTCLCWGREKQAFGLRACQSMFERFNTVFLVEGDDSNSSLDRTHLSNYRFSWGRLIAVEYNSVAWLKACFKKSECKSRAVSLHRNSKHYIYLTCYLHQVLWVSSLLIGHRRALCHIRVLQRLRPYTNLQLCPQGT